MRSPLPHALVADRYAIDAPIGKGRSTVYRGTDTRLGRPVALKEVRLHSDDESLERVRRRALREAQAAARLNNPSVVTVYDVVEEEGSIWLVMELVDAPSLSQLVADRGPLDHARVALIGSDVLGALEAAHGVGVVHRDVKPANVLVGLGQRAKLADFGVAFLHDDTRVTATGLVIGSPAYMAPEQALGESVGPAADLWALGATLYYAYEGRPPFDGGNAVATASAVVHGSPRAEQHPGPLSPIVARLLVKDPADRPSARELHQLLLDVAAAPTSTPPAAAAAVPAPEAESEAETENETQAETEAVEGGPAEATAATAAIDRQELAPATAPLAPAEGPDDREPPGPEPGTGLRPSQQRSRRSVARWVLVGAVVLVGLLWFVSIDPDDFLGSDGDGGNEQEEEPPPDEGEDEGEDESTASTAAAAQPPDPDPATETTTSPETTATTTTTTTTTAPPAASGVPAGWRTYTHPEAGYTIAHPAGWQVVPNGHLVDIEDPNSSTYLRVDWTDEPKDDPVADWEAQAEDFAGSHAGYQEHRIEAYTYRDYEAAMWEFSWDSGGTRLHAGNLGFVAGNRGYALFFVTAEPDWSASQPTFTGFQQSFRP